MRELEFALIDAGFWSEYQLAAWGEIPGARCVAVCDPSLEKAQQRALQAGVPNAYSDGGELFDKHELDFVDIVSTVESHASLASMALQRGVAAICQKPLAESLDAARELCDQSRTLRVPCARCNRSQCCAAGSSRHNHYNIGSSGGSRGRFTSACGHILFRNPPLSSERFRLLRDIGGAR